MNYLHGSGIFCKQKLEVRFGRKAMAHERVILAILRMSRERYLHPDVVRDASTKLARCIDGRHWFITKRVFDDEDMYKSNHVGLIGGVVPFQNGGVLFHELLKIINKKKTKKSIPIELVILNLTLKEMKNGN